MNSIKLFNKCCGCGCCEKVCPKHAISLIVNKRGFLRPFVDETLCVNCGLCKTVCDFNKEPHYNKSIVYYAYKSNDSIRKESQSGGAFFVIAYDFLRKHQDNSAVYGASLFDNRCTKHIRVTTIEQLPFLQKSKYAKSDFQNTYSEVCNDLEAGKFVLFSGTPCQVSAIKSYLEYKKVDTKKLLLIDIICHGTPPSKFWEEYVDYLETKYSKTIIEARFRDKEYGWATHFETFLFNDGTKIKLTKYRDLFYSYHTLDEGCFLCKYSSYSRYSDITLGDLWGNQTNLIGFKDQKGVSLVIINTLRGYKDFKNVLTSGASCIVSKDETKQPNLLHPSPKPRDYEKFWLYYENKGFKKTIRKYIDFNVKKKTVDFWKRVSNKLKRTFKH